MVKFNKYYLLIVLLIIVASSLGLTMALDEEESASTETVASVAIIEGGSSGSSSSEIEAISEPSASGGGSGGIDDGTLTKTTSASYEYNYEKDSMKIETSEAVPVNVPTEAIYFGKFLQEIKNSLDHQGCHKGKNRRTCCFLQAASGRGIELQGKNSQYL